MKNSTKHSQLILAKQGGFMPSYWSAISNNDRTPEICPGSMEDRIR